MNLGRNIVANILCEGKDALKQFLEAGFDMEWATDPEDLSRVAVFSDNDLDAYKFIVRQYIAKRDVPTVGYFQHSFPAKMYKLPEPDITTAELLDMAQDDRLRVQLEDTTSELIDSVEGGQYRAAHEIIQRAARIREAREFSDVHVVWDAPEWDVKPRVHRDIKQGVITGIPELDDNESFPGWQPGDLVTYLGRPKAGKALALDTPIPTPDGWTTMGDIQEGDAVFDEHGQVCKVTAATPVMYNRECYEVEFRSGETLIADAEHQWVTECGGRSAGSYTRGVRTTAEIKETLRIRGRNRHRVPVAEALELPERLLPMDPYILGYWLGDGNSSGPVFTVSDEDADHFVQAVASAGYLVVSDVPNKPSGRKIRVTSAVQKFAHGSLGHVLGSMGLLNNKHIPDEYLRASYAQRLALLQGLMDSDGYMSKRYEAEYTSISEALALGVQELVHSLGFRTRLRKARAMFHGVDCGPKFRVFFVPQATPVFGLPRKLERHVPRQTGTKSNYRYVQSVTPVNSVSVRCIQVDSPDSTYLAGREMIPTHNTSFFLLSALQTYLTQSKRVMFVSVEVAAGDDAERPGIADKLDAFSAGIDYIDYSRGQLNEGGRAAERLRKTRKDMYSAGEFVIVQPIGTYTIDNLESDIENYNPDVVYVDGFYLMTDVVTKKSGGNWEGHDNLARAMKFLAVRRSVVLLTSMQVRGKQLSGKGKAIDNDAMMGGTGLVMWSTMVIGVNIDEEHEVHTINCTASRVGYLPTVRGTWNWDNCTFHVVSDIEFSEETF